MYLSATNKNNRHRCIDIVKYKYKGKCLSDGDNNDHYQKLNIK